MPHQALNKNSSLLPGEDLVPGQVKEIKFFCPQDANAPGVRVLFTVGAGSKSNFISCWKSNWYKPTENSLYSAGIKH